MNKADIVRDFITKNPEVKSKKEIAKTLVKTHPKLFKDLESARSSVRFVTGSNGETNRRKVNSTEQKFFYNGFNTWAQNNLNSEDRPWDEPFVIPSSIKELNIIADLHSVHLDHKVMEKFLKSTKNKEALLLNGDLLDSETLSRHLISHNAVEYDKEVEICRQILKGLKEEFNHVYFKEGNHDFWLERYLLINSRAMLSTFKERGVNVQELLQCAGIGVNHIHNLKYIQYGDLDIIHGHEFPGFGNGKFPSVGVLDKWQSFKKSYKVKILCSHSHKLDKSISRKAKNGDFGEAWVTPAMCKKGSHYAPYAGWDNGWAVVKVNDEGVTNVELILA